MKVKTNELIDLALDWAVANALPEPKNTLELLDRCIYNGFNPSTNWAQGGPIIERELIETYRQDGKWYCYILSRNNPELDGSTPLIAAMRCYVASKLGDEVDVPEELV